MKRYTLGLVFDKNGQNVALMLKNRPAWQAGAYNGIGGKVEPGESPAECMVREAEEEAGIQHACWTPFLVLGGEDVSGDLWKMHVFKLFYDLDTIKQMEDQPIHIFPSGMLPENVMPNITWMVPMALSMEKDYADFFEIQEQKFPQYLM